MASTRHLKEDLHCMFVAVDAEEPIFAETSEGGGVIRKNKGELLMY